VHPSSICETSSIGEGTTVWAYTHILKGATIGQNCNICDHVFIENEVKIGDRVTIKNGVQIWNGVTISSDVFIGPNVTFTNDFFPKSRNENFFLQKTLVMSGASIGGGSTILPNITIGKGSLIGAGAVITKDVPEYAVVVGNPGRVIRFLDSP